DGIRGFHVTGVQTCALPILLGGNTGRSGLEEGVHGLIVGANNIPAVQGIFQGRAVDGGYVCVQQAGPVQLPQDGGNTTGTVNVLNMVVGGVRRHFAELGYLAGQTIDIAQGEVDLGFLGSGQQVQDSVSRATHGDVQGHGVSNALKLATERGSTDSSS